MAPPPAQILSGIRLGVGAGAWLAPNLTGRLFGLPEQSAETAFLARLFGARDVALAVGTTATVGPSRRLWWQLGIACDLLDVGAAFLAQRDGGIPRTAALMAGGTALAAAGLGVAALAAES